MSRSLIHVANTSSQPVNPATGSPAFVNLGGVVRRYGCNIRLSGNAIEQDGGGYYNLLGSITVAPTAAGVVTMALFENGGVLPGSQVSGSVTTAANPVTLPLIGTSRICGCCSSSIQVGVIEGAGNVLSVTLKDEKA